MRFLRDEEVLQGKSLCVTHSCVNMYLYVFQFVHICEMCLEACVCFLTGDSGKRPQAVRVPA